MSSEGGDGKNNVIKFDVTRRKPNLSQETQPQANPRSSEEKSLPGKDNVAPFNSREYITRTLWLLLDISLRNKQKVQKSNKKKELPHIVEAFQREAFALLHDRHIITSAEDSRWVALKNESGPILRGVQSAVDEHEGALELPLAIVTYRRIAVRAISAIGKMVQDILKKELDAVRN